MNAGSVLVGEITLTDQTATRFNYRCRFQGIPFMTLPIQNVNELRWCIETLEAYNLVLCSNYPATPSTSFREIEILTGTTHPVLNWTLTVLVADCGQNVKVVSNANPGGQVNIFY